MSSNWTFQMTMNYFKITWKSLRELKTAPQGVFEVKILSISSKHIKWKSPWKLKIDPKPNLIAYTKFNCQNHLGLASHPFIREILGIGFQIANGLLNNALKVLKLKLFGERAWCQNSQF